ncbi:polymer-forming protein [Hydrogenoanaerobacterium saccharovorans]|uniref:Polymer-forming protein n=1 Tax=Hydrogenoanaerobacterium saccharovorans TaxID=474960 RepID=A0A1H7YR44_9FIRM|nr:polymer-forming cytoskeletal protein [Hydrogenoanaerobacterium saccharovorans]RPF49110.1 polymer-forming protein [Hydrogenoanaerobacterium saccharovorans]SEM47659.1 Polymer-forming protein [Hydrogenoanaerobacterium saccharovorans]
MFFKTKNELNEKKFIFNTDRVEETTDDSIENSTVESIVEEPAEDVTPAEAQKDDDVETEQQKIEPVIYDSDLVASISRNTTINGSIITKDNLDIFGDVNGTISSECVVKAYGTILGDIQCKTLVANGATITGDISCVTSAIIGDNVVVSGNITSPLINVSGKVDGNLTAAESITITNTAVITGDISTPVFEVAKGAVVEGKIMMDKLQHNNATCKFPKRDEPSSFETTDKKAKKKGVTKLEFPSEANTGIQNAPTGTDSK